MQLKIKLFLLIALILGATAAGTFAATVGRPTNAELVNNAPIWPTGNAAGEITIKAVFQSQTELEKNREGDWVHYLYRVVYRKLEVLKGSWPDPELSFLVKDTWPTKESGIMVKKIPWPFREKQGLIFDLKRSGTRYVIIGYREPGRVGCN